MKLNYSQRKKTITLLFTVAFCIAAVSAQSAIVIPTQVNSTLESIRDAFTGDIAKTIVGICFAGSCIAYAYNKDNDKMKAKMIAVMIGTGLLGLTQTIINSVMSINT